MKFSNHIYTDNRRVFMNKRNHNLASHQFEVVAIGDSITEGLNLNRFQYVDYTWLNSGISGDISTLLTDRVSVDCLDFKPQVVSLMIGINDIRNYFNKMDYIHKLSSEDELRKVLISSTLEIVSKLIAANVEVIYTQILPVNEVEKNNGYINQFIDEINLELYNELKDDVTIIKANSFKNEVNNLDLNFTYDGLHLNELGYQVWCELLNKEVRRKLGK
ncbi:GDSL-type esterase/lipase family protein [Mollicutes bacterium LVI A0078]|nr:GDSL-type esterase/lipase family protein [Mollicutes bacterium LVI A0075]WOO90200.1 GDSL-type esterase/lipase family protein [Mollicutes bacterium LVI A0078]